MTVSEEVEEGLLLIIFARTWLSAVMLTSVGFPFSFFEKKNMLTICLHITAAGDGGKGSNGGEGGHGGAIGSSNVHSTQYYLGSLSEFTESSV